MDEGLAVFLIFLAITPGVWLFSCGSVQDDGEGKFWFFGAGIFAFGISIPLIVNILDRMT